MLTVEHFMRLDMESTLYCVWHVECTWYRLFLVVVVVVCCLLLSVILRFHGKICTLPQSSFMDQLAWAEQRWTLPLGEGSSKGRSVMRSCLCFTETLRYRSAHGSKRLGR